jgi:hypothetical protein
MSHVQVQSGICGFETDIRMTKTKKWNLEISVESTCDLVSAFGNEVTEMGMNEILKTPIDENPIYEKAGQCNMHASCAVPCGILKAAEVELGLALKKDAHILFKDES